MSPGAGDPVEVVIFDAGLTLVRAEPSFLHVFADGLRRAGVGIDVTRLEGWNPAFREAWRSHGTAWEQAEEPSPHLGDLEVERRFWRGLYGRMLEELGIEGDHPEIAQQVYEAFLDPASWGTYPEVDEVLTELEERGVRTALLSNWGPSLRRLLLHLDLEHRFEAVVISGEVGVAKPDLAIFDRALDALGELPGPHVAYVGDDRDYDVVPSRRLGLRAVLVDRHHQALHHDGPRVEDLRELPDALPLAEPASR